MEDGKLVGKMPTILDCRADGIHPPGGEGGPDEQAAGGFHGSRSVGILPTLMEDGKLVGRMPTLLDCRADGIHPPGGEGGPDEQAA